VKDRTKPQDFYKEFSGSLDENRHVFYANTTHANTSDQ
jgi:hypothetical protein